MKKRKKDIQVGRIAKDVMTKKGSFSEDIQTSLNGLEKCEMLTRQELVPSRHGTPGCSEPKDQQDKTDKFLSLLGVMYVIVNSRRR